MIDCSNILNYQQEFKRMCKSYKRCVGCAFEGSSVEEHEFYTNIEVINQKIIDVVQKWSDEHPQKMRKDDFIEKFPSARPLAIRPYLVDDSIYNKTFPCYGIRIGEWCRDCMNEYWNEVIEEQK